MANSDAKASRKRRSKWKHLKKREGRNFTHHVLRYVPLFGLLLRILEFIFNLFGLLLRILEFIFKYLR